MSVIVVLFALLALVDAMGSVKQCPKGCTCEVASFDSHLSVDCEHGTPESKTLHRQVDSLLSVEHFRERLESLNITNTPLTRVPASVCQLLNLTTLHIDHNHRITELPDNCFTKLTKLVTLSLQHNSIQGLQDGLFDGLQSLKILKLPWNQIDYIGLRVFSNASDLTSLRELDLGVNQLISLEPWWYYRCIASPVTIKLHWNQIAKFTNKLQFDFRCGMQRPTGYLILSYNSIVHLTDSFRAWNITKFEDLACLFGNHSMKVELDGEYECDCVDFLLLKLIRLAPKGHSLQRVYCGNFHTVNGQYIFPLAVTVDLNELVCELFDHCPSSCRCVYRPANATLHVYCSSANIFSLPLHLPPLPKSYVRYKLDFSNNKHLTRLEHRPYFVNTSVLDVSNCAINNIDIKAWRELAAMRSPFVTPHIYLHNNKIKSLPFEVTGINSSLVIFTLYNNLWDCSCENRWMIAWFKSLTLASSYIGDVSCVSPSRLNGKVILHSTDDDFCVNPATGMLKISLASTLPPVAVLMMIGLAVYRLRVRLYRRWKFHPFDRDECVGEDKDFDVFLCCSSEDHNPHGLRILELIESSGYRVCYHVRDFLAGAAITENMIEAVKRSKRTVCLVSKNFLARYS